MGLIADLYYKPLITVIELFGEPIRTHDPLFADNWYNFEAMRTFNPLISVLEPFGEPEPILTHDPLFADNPPIFESTRTHDPLMYPKPRINPGISRNSGSVVLNLLLKGRKSSNSGTRVLNYANAAN